MHTYSVFTTHRTPSHFKIFIQFSAYPIQEITSPLYSTLMGPPIQNFRHAILETVAMYMSIQRHRCPKIQGFYIWRLTGQPLLRVNSSVLPVHLEEQMQGINLKGCLYFIGKGNLKFSPFKMKGYKNCPSCMNWSFCWKCTLSCLSFKQCWKL